MEEQFTKEEIEAFRARTTRIWKIKGELTWKPQERKFYGEVEGGAYLNYWPDKDLDNAFFLFSPDGHGGIEYSEDAGLFEFGSSLDLEFIRFCDKWRPFFRRSCWLSGCPIEATAHERVEWMQGFTREEIKAWNIDF